MLYYPCIYDNRSGRIVKQVSQTPMDRERCEKYLQHHFLALWRSCEAIPQLSTHPGLIPAWQKGGDSCGT